MINRILIVLLIGVLISCNNADKQSQNLPKSGIDSSITGDKLNGNWELIKVNDTLFSIEKVYSINYGGPPTITINKENNKIGGFTGCNAWGTGLNVQNNTLFLNGPIEKHEQVCGGTWEAEFLNFLRNNTSFTLLEDKLNLTSRDNKTMTFKRVG